MERTSRETEIKVASAVRIASLVPAATDWVLALGLGRQLVGVSSACPPVAPVVVRSILDEAPLDAAGVDKAVARAAAAGVPIHRLDADALRKVDPDVLLVQGLCDVCAPGHALAREARDLLGRDVAVVDFSPHSLAEALGGGRVVAEAAGAPHLADGVVAALEARLEAVAEAVAGRPRPRVGVLEWVDPPMACGHWFPDVVAAAGGREVLGVPGGKSDRISWVAVAAANVDALLVQPCGYPLAGAVGEARRVAARFPGVPVVAFDARRYFSRAGPGLVTSVELVAHALHPDAVPDPDPTGHAVVAQEGENPPHRRTGRRG